MNPYGSRRRREGCLRTMYGDASQSIASGDLVVVALEHPTHPTPNNWSVRSDPTPNAQSNAQRPTPKSKTLWIKTAQLC